jgi:hypothetical protein
MKNECNIIRDILPLYVEDMVSADTSAFVEEHLEKCAECRADWENLKKTSQIEEVPLAKQDNDILPLRAIKKKWKRKKAVLICTTVLITILISVIGLYFCEPVQEFVLTKRPNEINADTVVILHSSNGDISSQEVTITDKDTVSELLSMHNSLKVMYMSRPSAEERMRLIFYKEDKIISEWGISFYEEDGVLITWSNAFVDKGNHVVKSEFDYTRLVEIFNTATN